MGLDARLMSPLLQYFTGFLLKGEMGSRIWSYLLSCGHLAFDINWIVNDTSEDATYSLDKKLVK